MKPRVRYLLALLTPIAPWIHWAANNFVYDWKAALQTLIAIHLLIPLADWLIGPDKQPDPTNAPPTHWFNQAIPYACAVLWFAALGLGAWQASLGTHTDWIVIGISIGAIGGVTAINVAHELIHRSNRYERELGGLLLSSVSYSAFRIEHVMGHHLRVATPADTATARRGETIYQFIPRSVFGTLTNAWRLESARHKRRRSSHWWQNQYITGVLLTGLVAVLLASLFGGQAIGLLMLISAVAIIELEIINYIEHYGLMRNQREDGRYEPVGPQHSWNANTALVNAFLINLQRHSDHHAHAGRDYMHLRSHDQAPQLPAGYGAMVLLALVPPWWRRVIHPRIDALGQPATQLNPQPSQR